MNSNSSRSLQRKQACAPQAASPSTPLQLPASSLYTGHHLPTSCSDSVLVNHFPMCGPGPTPSFPLSPLSDTLPLHPRLAWQVSSIGCLWCWDPQALLDRDQSTSPWSAEGTEGGLAPHTTSEGPNLAKGKHESSLPHKNTDHTTIAQGPSLAFMVLRAMQGTEEGCQGAKAVRSEAAYGRQSTALPSPHSVKSSAESDHFLPEHSWSCDTTGDSIAD